MGSDTVPAGAIEPAAGALQRVWAAVKRIAANDVLLVSFALGLLIVIFFYDVVFLGQTLLASPFAYERFGVTGTSPPFGYPGEPPDYNYYLMDPLPGAWQGEPTVEKVARLIRDFQIPLWDANTALGRPLLASTAAPSFSPVRLPLIIWPSPEMWDAFLLARFFVAGLFTYLLAKRLGLAKPAAFGAAVAFTFSGYFMLFINMPQADFAMMIPVLLYAFELLLERPGPGRIAFAAVAVALGVLAANPEAAAVLLLYGTAYYLARALALSLSEGGFRPWSRVLRLGLALGIGVGLTAFILVPFLELSGSLGFGGHSVSLHGPDSGRGLEFAPLQSLISVFVPYFHGPPWLSFLGGGWTGIRHYAGVVVPMLAFIGLWNRPAMAKAGWFFLGATVLLVAKWYGVPGVNWVGRLPLLEVISFGLYLIPAIAFSLAMLAGVGLDQLSRVGWRWWHLLLAVVVVASLLGWLVWLNRGVLASIPDTHLALQFAFVGAIILAAVAMILATRRGLVPSQAGIALLVGLIAVELFAFTTPTKGEFAGLARAAYGQENVPVIDRPQRYDPFTEPPYITFLREDSSKYRVFGLDRVLYPNTSEAFDIDDVRGVTATTVERYLKYIRSFIDPSGEGLHRFTGGRWPPLNTKGGASLLANNQMLDLLNVKYVIAPRGLPLAYDYDLAERFLPAAPEENSSSRLAVFRINGEDEAVLFQHPISSLSYALTPDEESRFLLFRLGLDPEVWRPDRGDGVLFRVLVQDNGTEEGLFSRWVDPKNNPEDRRWIDGVVDLSPYLGQTVTLVLSVAPGDSGIWDWAGWGSLRLAPSPETPPDRSSSSQFELVYDGGVKVYENRNAFPRAFIVHRAVPAAAQDSAIALMRRPDFDPSTEAIVEGDLSPDQLAALAASPVADGSSVEITHYSDNRVELLARIENAGLLVLSDTYYPGWKAYVDGKQAPVYPTDLTLRSVFLPAGEHRVEFVYSPGSFKLGLAIAIASLVLLVLYASWGPARRMVRGWMSRRAG